MAIRRTLYLRVRIPDSFPPNDPLVPCILRLMAVVNELRTLSKLWLFLQSRAGATSSERETVKGEHFYIFRLTCGALYEAAVVFQELRREIQKAGMLGVTEKLDGDAGQAFVTLSSAFREGFETTGWGNILVQLRNTVAFHYPPARVFRIELENYLTEHGDLGDLILGEIVGLSRYLLADELQVRVFGRPLLPNFEYGVRELSRTVGDFIDQLSKFLDGLVGYRLERNPDAIAERREETINTEHLWGLP